MAAIQRGPCPKVPAEFDRRPLAGARGRVCKRGIRRQEAPTSAGEWAPVEFGGNLRARPSLDRSRGFLV